MIGRWTTQGEYSHRLNRLEEETIKELKTVPQIAKKPAVLWSTGKDSTLMLYLVQKAFGYFPWPVIHIDTGKKFPEIYKFREDMRLKYKIPLRVVKNEEALKLKFGPDNLSKFECCTQLKTNALKEEVRKQGYDALILSIRHDEHYVRGMEDLMSLRDEEGHWKYTGKFGGFGLNAPEQGTYAHIRINAILPWTEVEVWEYTLIHNIPVNPLYFSNSQGERYRSLGCMPCTKPLKSKARTIREIVDEVYMNPGLERSGRMQDKEDKDTMLRLRQLGYM